MLANRVREFTTTVGTGDITLGGALAGHVRFVDAFAPGDSVIYVIEDADNYEIGIGTLSGAALLARTTVSETLVDGVLDKETPVAIALSGSARVYCAVSADYLLNPIKEADLIKEVTTDAGVYIDGVHLKDGGGVFSGSLDVVGDTSFGGDVRVAGSILSDNSTGGIVVSSDTSVGAGSNIVMYPSAHATRANDMDLRVNSTPWLSWDNSAGTAIFFGAVGMGGAPNAAYTTTIHNSTGAHLRLENDGELGFVNLSDSGNLNLWAHGDTGDSVDILTGSGIGTVNASFSATMFNVNTDANFSGSLDAKGLFVRDSAGGRIVLDDVRRRMIWA